MTFRMVQAFALAGLAFMAQAQDVGQPMPGVVASNTVQFASLTVQRFQLPALWTDGWPSNFVSNQIGIVARLYGPDSASIARRKAFCCDVTNGESTVTFNTLVTGLNTLVYSAKLADGSELVITNETYNVRLIQRCELSVVAQPGTRYVIQETTNHVDWFDPADEIYRVNTANGLTNLWITENPAEWPRAFFRALIVDQQPPNTLSQTDEEGDE